jgi:hypothetical protein
VYRLHPHFTLYSPGVSRVLFNDAVSCRVYTASMIDAWTWFIGGMIRKGKNRSSRTKTCAYARMYIANPTLNGLNIKGSFSTTHQTHSISGSALFWQNKAYSGNSLPTFRDNLSVSHFKGQASEIHLLRCGSLKSHTSCRLQKPIGECCTRKRVTVCPETHLKHRFTVCAERRISVD